MPILVLLPMLCVCENNEFSEQLFHSSRMATSNNSHRFLKIHYQSVETEDSQIGKDEIRQELIMKLNPGVYNLSQWL